MIEISKAVIEKEGKYLLLKRASHSKSYPDLWDFTGGKDDPGETHEESVIRETQEETSFVIDPGKEIKTIPYKDEKHDLLFHYFVPQPVEGEIKLSDDHSEYKWFSLEEIKILELHPAVRLYFGM